MHQKKSGELPPELDLERFASNVEETPIGEISFAWHELSSAESKRFTELLGEQLAPYGRKIDSKALVIQGKLHRQIAKALAVALVNGMSNERNRMLALLDADTPTSNFFGSADFALSNEEETSAVLTLSPIRLDSVLLDQFRSDAIIGINSLLSSFDVDFQIPKPPNHSQNVE